MWTDDRQEEGQQRDYLSMPPPSSLRLFTWDVGWGRRGEGKVDGGEEGDRENKRWEKAGIFRLGKEEGKREIRREGGNEGRKERRRERRKEGREEAGRREEEGREGR